MGTACLLAALLLAGCIIQIDGNDEPRVRSSPRAHHDAARRDAAVLDAAADASDDAMVSGDASADSGATDADASPR